MSAPVTLKAITLSAFRGSSSTFRLDFEKGKKLTLIYGENGTGKTTICDAFEFLAQGKIGSLENLGMGKGLEKFWPTAGKSASALAVELETSAAKCSGKFVNKLVSVSPAAARPRIELLRQRQILDLFQAAPAKRYDAIKRFIDIEAFEQSEEALRQLSKTLIAQKSQAQTAEQESLAALQESYEAAGKPAGVNAVDWARQKLAAPAASLTADIAALARMRVTASALNEFPTRFDTRATAVTSAKEKLAEADQALSAAIATATQGAGDLLPLLQSGRNYLHAHPATDECPLCQSKENIVGLAAKLDAKLEGLAVLTSANSEKGAKQSALAKAEGALAQVQADYQNAVGAFSAAQSGHKWSPSLPLPAAPPPSDPSTLAIWLAALEPIAASWAETEAAWRDESKFLGQLKASVQRYETNAASVLELATLIPKIEQALAESVDERQKFTDSIIAEIAQDVGKLYESVHPGEGLDKIALQLDPARRASLNLGANFEGHEVPPQAYFSQSHLDTLGLCVFLALAARDRASETILILDDVLGSVDEPHVERAIGMVYEVSKKFQHTIVTTHYRPWREKFRWGLLKPDQVCQFVELSTWSLGNGLALSGSVPEIVRLKSLLSETPPDVQSICGKSGVILEALLDFLTLKYGCAVPRRPGGTYTLGDLLPAINGKLLAALKAETLTHVSGAQPTISALQLKPILDDITKIASARNVMGAHFNPSAFDLYPADGIAFAKLVEQLADALICPDHGWPSKDKSGTHWANGGDTRRLHPLKKPS